MKLNLDFTQSSGTIRAINGSNLGPNLFNRRNYNENDDFRALKVPLARLHDAPLLNPGMRLVDIQHIFGNWKADESNPDNYYFKQTDDYIRNIRECGTDILYRLGPSIEHSLDNYYAFPPEDYDKWIRICINIIRHYNEGWNNGFSWKIIHWEIWNEPNAKPHQWSGADELYFELYCRAAKAIKARFPYVKIGGPALSCPEHGTAPLVYADKFLEWCKKENAPLDFYSWHCYPKDILALQKEPARMRDVLDRFGFQETELHLNEWHPACGEIYEWEGVHGHNGIEGACYAANVLSAWQDSPLDMANYYTCSSGAYGVIGHYPYRKHKNYYALLAFAKMLDYPDRVHASSPDPTVTILAGKNKEGKCAILISAYDTGENVFEVECPAPVPGSILTLDETLNLEPAGTGVEISEGRIVLKKQSPCALWLILP